jgi:protoporphyrinogen oxidase
VIAKTLIVGGGLAGLSCARDLGRGATVVEAASRPGGLCQSEVAGGFTFDWTGHWLHLRDPEIERLARERWLRDNLLEVERRAVVFSEHRWTRFPYQHNLHGLPPETIAECLEGFVEATLGEPGRDLRERPLRDAAEFVRRHLGPGFLRRFLRPYNEKLFAVPLEELSPEWGGRFVPRPGLREVLRGALGLAEDDAGYNARFVYPREGGIEALVRGLLADAQEAGADLWLGARVEAIDLARRTVRVRRAGPGPSSAEVVQEHTFGALVWTGSLREAARMLAEAPADVRAAGEALRAVSVTVVEIGAEEIGGRPFHWAYFPEARFRFYRVGSPSQVNPALAPPGCRSFSVEYSHRGPLDPTGLAPQGTPSGGAFGASASLVEETVASLAALGLLDPARVRVARARTIPVAYALFDARRAQARELLLQHFARHGVQLAGRYGLWEYSSMEDAILSGRAAASAVQAAMEDGGPRPGTPGGVG